MDQLPGPVREFANYLDGLLGRLDQRGGWCGVFWQRDPDGMQACVDGREVPPWDVLEALLQDLAAAYGPATAGAEKERARPLHTAAVSAYDALPGARDTLGDRLDVMLREQRYAAERQAELGRLLTAATSREEADALRLDLAWARDDHERAGARCAELRWRMAESDRRAAEVPIRDAPVAWRAEQAFEGPRGAGEGLTTGADALDSSGPDVPARTEAAPEGAGPVAPRGAGSPFAPGHGSGPVSSRPSEAPVGNRNPRPASASAGQDVWFAGPGVGRDSSFAGSDAGGVSRSTVSGGSPALGPAGYGAAPVGDGHARPASASAGQDVWFAGSGGSPSLRSAGHGTVPVGDGHARPASASAGQDVWFAGPGVGQDSSFAGSDAGGVSRSTVSGGSPALGPAGYGAAPVGDGHARPASASAGQDVWFAGPGGGRDSSFVGSDAGGVSRPAVSGGSPVQQPAGHGAAPDPGKPRKRRRGSARFAGMAEGEGDPVVVPQDGAVAVPEAPVGRRAPRGARFAGAAEAVAPVQASVEAVDAEAGPAVVGAVEKLAELRAQGRSGEAHVLLVEIAHWPAARFPLLADGLHRAGLGADWATLLWEAASLPAERLVAAADALEAAGRTEDGLQMLRQGVARPAAEIGAAVLGLAAEGRPREVRALLDAYVRVRTPEEAARSAAADPGRLVPLLLEAAQGVSEERHWDLVHALRVAGFTP
ncbi:hypothetical protein AQI88_03130 [Streptomyces cellostaticus]|uniref:UL36 very large tegument protein n=1 Tax=Streptomyces cellostaticus TaxID=67285 RepID=A0A117PY65_9ACTN|nr:hypothetical protein AQI88_03130 [Streptomyces cellostaticus]